MLYVTVKYILMCLWMPPNKFFMKFDIGGVLIKFLYKFKFDLKPDINYLWCKGLHSFVSAEVIDIES